MNSAQNKEVSLKGKIMRVKAKNKKVMNRLKENGSIEYHKRKIPVLKNKKVDLSKKKLESNKEIITEKLPFM